MGEGVMEIGVMEIWKPILGWEDLYEVSSLGRIRSKGRWRKGRGRGKSWFPGGETGTFVHKRNGYLSVSLTGNGRRKQALVHRLVLTAFVGPAPEGMEGCHNDGDRTNPALDNLRWDTRKNNHADKKKHGTWQCGEKNPFSKLTNEIVFEIRTSNEPNYVLAKKYGVSVHAIKSAKNYKTWAHIGGSVD